MKQKIEENKTAGVIEFEDNLLLPALYGEHNSNLARIENEFGCMLSSKGNLLSLEGSDEACSLSRDVLISLYNRLEKGHEVTAGDVDGAIRLVSMLDSPEAKFC